MFTIGCDPEIFLVDARTSKPVSAYGVVKGTKREPFKVPAGAYQVDGMALEFNTDPVPATGQFPMFDKNIVSVMKKLKEDVKANGFKTVRFNIAPVQDFGEDLMAEQPKEAKELGCDPDWNAYTKEPNPRPDGDVTFRTASGHIHVGWGADIPVDHPDHIDICAGFVKKLDMTVGMFMTLIDTDPRRRELYGKAGAFRPKPYGVEYRTPSNVWLTHKNRRRIIYDLVNLATWLNMQNDRSVKIAVTGQPYLNYGAWGPNPYRFVYDIPDLDTFIQTIINTGDTANANRVLQNILNYVCGTATYSTTRRMLNAELKRMAGKEEPTHAHIVERETKKETKRA